MDLTVVQISRRLEDFEDEENKEGAIALLQQIQEAWAPEHVQQLVHAAPVPVAHLRNICHAAMRYNVENLFVRMIVAGIAPEKLLVRLDELAENPQEALNLIQQVAIGWTNVVIHDLRMRENPGTLESVCQTALRLNQVDFFVRLVSLGIAPGEITRRLDDLEAKGQQDEAKELIHQVANGWDAVVIQQLRDRRIQPEIFRRICRAAVRFQEMAFFMRMMRAGVCPEETSWRLQTLEENKQQEDAVTLLENLNQSWNDELIQLLRERTQSEVLRQICRQALRFIQLGLYTRLIRAGVCPINEESESSAYWTTFMNTVMNTNSTGILVASLRFFQEFDQLWFQHIAFLRSHAELSFADSHGLGSITRITFKANRNNHAQRSADLTALLRDIWQAGVDAEGEENLPPSFRPQRSGLFLNAMNNSGLADQVLFAAFEDGSDVPIWTEQAVRNLIRVSVEGLAEIGPAAFVVEQFFDTLQMTADQRQQFMTQLEEIEGGN
jgi:hypothetical protein